MYKILREKNILMFKNKIVHSRYFLRYCISVLWKATVEYFGVQEPFLDTAMQLFTTAVFYMRVFIVLGQKMHSLLVTSNNV